MFRLMLLLCAAIFLTQFLVGRSTQAVRDGLVPGRVASLVYARPGEEASPKPRVVSEAAPLVRPVAAAPVVDRAVAAPGPAPAPAVDGEAKPGTTLTLALPLVNAASSANAVEQEPVTDEPGVQYVSGRSVNVRADPSADSEALTQLDRGEAVLVLPSDTPGWSLIRIEGDGVQGYVASRFLGPRPEDELFNAVD